MLVCCLQADAGDKLVIVDFYAQWCAACRALFPKVRPLHVTLACDRCMLSVTLAAHFPLALQVISTRSCHKRLSLYVQLCSICEDNDDIVLLKVDWDQNKPIARPLGVKVRIGIHCQRCYGHHRCSAAVLAQVLALLLYAFHIKNLQGNLRHD